MPLVSVVIPAYNSAQFLPETIDSILQQDFSDFEIIIVDDKSTDDTKSVIDSIGSDKIRYICLEENHGGPSKPRNRGIREAKGELIAFCDSDDLWMPDHLGRAVVFLAEEPSVAMVFTDEEKFDNETGESLGNFLTGYDRFASLPKKQVATDCFIIEPDRAYSCLFYENFVLTCGVVGRKSVFDNVGMFDETLTNGDDKDMWFRITKCHPIGFINKIGFKYRARGGSISTREASLIINRIKVLQKQLENGLPADLERECRNKIALNYRSLGYCYRESGDMKNARKSYWKSFLLHPEKDAVYGIILSALGENTYFFLKKLKNRTVPDC